ncbi:adenosine receptor A2b-like [Apostichopus japonicus]|uniref:adenosine receptor A2b-like n=1 Tax=Stichopus japonicus TaxID=307972 RepID=UPI003AB7EEDE
MGISNYTDGVLLRIGYFPFTFYLLFHGVLAFLIISGNIAVIVTTLGKKFKRTPNNVFLCSLAVADLLTGVIALPAILFARVVVSFFTCSSRYRTILFAPGYVFIFVSVFHLIAVTIDRYIAVSFPLRYRSIMTMSRCKIIMLFGWILGIIFGSMPTIGTSLVPNQWVCGTENYNAKVVTVHSLLGASFSPLATMILLVCYVRIFVIAKQHLKNVAERRSVGMSVKLVHHLESKSRMRATVTSILVVTVFGIFTIPVSVKLFLEVYLSPSEQLQFIIQTCTEFWLLAISAMNPVIYSLRNKRYRLTYVRLFVPVISKHVKTHLSTLSQTLTLTGTRYDVRRETIIMSRNDRD